MSKSTNTKATAAARRAKLNKLSLLGAGVGAVPGLLAGLAYTSPVISPLVATLLGLVNGAIGGVIAVLAMATFVGLERQKPWWWAVTAALFGGLVGQVVITKLIEWILLLVQWVIETGGFYGIFIFD